MSQSCEPQAYIFEPLHFYFHWFLEFLILHQVDFACQFIVSDTNEALSFPCKFSCKKFDYVKLTDIQMAGKRSSESNFR